MVEDDETLLRVAFYNVGIQQQEMDKRQQMLQHSFDTQKASMQQQMEELQSQLSSLRRKTVERDTDRKNT